MITGASRPLLILSLTACFAALTCASNAVAQSMPSGGFNSSPDSLNFNLDAVPSTPLDLPGIDSEADPLPPGSNSYAPPRSDAPLATAATGEITLAAHLTEDSEEIPRGLVWRVFKPEVGPDGKLPLVASSRGGTSIFKLPPGSYLVHAAFGRAGATKRISIGHDAKREDLVLDAGGLKLDAVLSGGVRIPPNRLKFSIYESEPDATGDRALIIPDVSPDTIVRLKAGTYHVVSTYGTVNAVIRSDIRVEAGKLTEATVEHRAAHLTMKLVRETGGEAIADTAWSILTDTGDIVRETVGAYASMVLAEGDYTIIAKNRDRIYQRDFSVMGGHNQDVELLPTDLIETKESSANLEVDSE